MNNARVLFRLLSATGLPLLTVLALALLGGAGQAAPASKETHKSERRSAGAVIAYKGSIELPTYPWGATKHPYFRGTDKVNIYPYPMLDFLSREKTNRMYRTVVLENEYLRITFLPELGGKIHEVTDKTTGQPMFYVNHVIKPGLIGQCGAWTSGGVEWNTGPQGHTVSCMQPIPVQILAREKDGSQAVAIGETERIYGTRWTVVVTLRPDRSFIEERIRIYNPTEYIRPYYFWNCTAAPNTSGFRFIYPMTLGCDHAGEKFFRWPIDEGKDLSRGTNYQDASSIFAWHCDQDFFGSYNDDLDHGAVSYANHHQLPGKKAWTWGYGGFGRMHQMDLTDDDGPYNEVQTGPLLTQAQVGRLDPSEAVEWDEWWYPVHGIGGFSFANKEVAINATLDRNTLDLKLIGTSEQRAIEVRVGPDRNAPTLATCSLSPSKATVLKVPVASGKSGSVFLLVKGQILASFTVPAQLPTREPPAKTPAPEMASEWLNAAWQDWLFAHFQEAEEKFGKVLAKDPKNAEARVGLAYLKLDRDPKAAAQEAEEALKTNPDQGLAHLVSAVAAMRDGSPAAALESAWAASRSPETAIAARVALGKLLLRANATKAAVDVLAGPGAWETDATCMGLRSYALLLLGKNSEAEKLAESITEFEPLDAFGRAVLWLARGGKSTVLESQLTGQTEAVVRLAAEFRDLNHPETAARVLQEFYFKVVKPELRDPLPGYYAAALLTAGANPDLSKAWEQARHSPKIGVWPCDPNFELGLQRLARQNQDGKACLYLGHLLFHLRRDAEARELWKKAAEFGAEPAVAYRALGMAAKTLEGDLKASRQWLEKANSTDSHDSIVARDLANVLLVMAEKCDSDAERNQLVTEARDRLRGSFAEGKSRSDFVALLARAQNKLGDYAETAQMLDKVRVTVWEGAHEVHDLFEQAHLALGESHLKDGRAEEALREFDRALEYPANLATGKLENARQAHIQLARGKALDALGRKQEAKAAWKKAAEEPESKDTRTEAARKAARELLERQSS